MSPDDPRHGTWAGYQRGCRADCCTSGARNYQKRRAYDAERGMPRMVPVTGTERRLQALQAIGWDRETISAKAGRSRAWVQQILRGNPRIFRATADRIAGVYDELADIEPPMETRMQKLVANRTRNRARIEGWLPPSAWFGVDIDDPASEPDPGWAPLPPRGGRQAALLEDFTWLVEGGVGREQAAKRVGLGLKTIERYELRLRDEMEEEVA